MAYMFPDAGMQVWMGQYPGTTARETTINLHLCTAPAANATVAHNAVLAAVTETAYTNYLKQAMTTANWASAAFSESTPPGQQQQYTGSPVAFPAVGATGATITGYFMTNGAATTLLCHANFSDLNPVTLATNDIIKLSPTLGLLH